MKVQFKPKIDCHKNVVMHKTVGIEPFLRFTGFYCVHKQHKIFSKLVLMTDVRTQQPLKRI